MVSPRPTEHTIDRTPEYEEFINKLREFHTERGTRFDPEPKITPYQLDLLKIFKHVVQSGGYDKITDEKLAWRRVCAELGIRAANEAAAAFSLKTAYYKNLAAYEIRTVHNQTPPPPEILEETSAKGGSLLTRTLSNFKPKDRRDTSTQNSPAPSGDDGTPARESRPEEPPSTGRAARGLRHAPPQRVIFQPETGPTRPPRQASAQHHAASSTPQGSHGAHGHATTSQGNGQGQMQSASRMTSHQMSHAPLGQIPQPHIVRGGASASFTPQNYEYHSTTVDRFRPPVNVPLPLRPVETPSNAPAKFLKPRAPLDPAPPAANRQAPLPGSKSHATLRFDPHSDHVCF
jgi:chromatin structure-remodeling complex subunit RSC9